MKTQWWYVFTALSLSMSLGCTKPKEKAPAFDWDQTVAEADLRVLSRPSQVVAVRTSDFSLMPTFAKGICAGAVVNLNVNGKLIDSVISAQHCLTPHTKEVDILLVPDKISVLLFPWFKYTHKHIAPRSSIQEFPASDLFVAPIPEDLPTERKFQQVISRQPDLGSVAYIQGFPASEEKGPVTLKCVHMGEILTQTIDLPGIRLSPQLICPIITNPGGFSGGPVFNEAGEYMGVVSSAYVDLARRQLKISYHQVICPASGQACQFEKVRRSTYVSHQFLVGKDLSNEAEIQIDQEGFALDNVRVRLGEDWYKVDYHSQTNP